MHGVPSALERKRTRQYDGQTPDDLSARNAQAVTSSLPTGRHANCHPRQRSESCAAL